MPCFISKFAPPSYDDFKIYQELGFTGTYEQYLERKQKSYDPNSTIFICGALEGLEHCHHQDCLQFNEFLCDYPVGDGKTCDFGMCPEHSYQIGEDLHYCKTHHDLWMAQKPTEIHVEENPIGYLVNQKFYPLDQAWIAKNKAQELQMPMIKIFAEKLD